MSTPTIRAALDAAEQHATAEGDGLAPRVLAMCKQRNWSLHWTSRGSYLHLEASELIEALRGKRGDPLAEAADVLLVLMSITENAGIAWSAVVQQTAATCSRLEACDQYPGEERMDSPAALAAPESQRDAVIAAVTEALGDAYDCQRVWEAWGVGTMGEDDFALVAEDSDRVAEIADAAIEAMRPAAPAAPEAGEVGELVAWLRTIKSVQAQKAATLLEQQAAPAPVVVPVAVSERPWEWEGWCNAEGQCWALSPDHNSWQLVKPRFLSFWVLLLPAHAIPLPQVGERES